MVGKVVIGWVKQMFISFLQHDFCLSSMSSYVLRKDKEGNRNLRSSSLED